MDGHRGSQGSRRWVGIGHSADPDAARAGAHAASAAMTGADVRLVVVLGAISYDLSALLAGVRSVTGDAPLVGCSTHGEIMAGGPVDGTVLVVVLGGEGFSATVASVEGVTGRQRAAGAELARTLGRAIDERPHRVLMLFTDSLLRDQEDILRGIYEVLGAAVPLFGGAAADRWAMDRTFQFDGGRVLYRSVVGVMLASDAPLSIGVGHGWTPVGEPMVVTACADGRVLTLDDRPALDEFLRRVDAPAEAYTDPMVFKPFALTRPIGVERRSGPEVRNLATEVDMVGRTIGGGGNIPQGALTWIMAGDRESILAAVSRTCEEAIAGLGGQRPLGLLAFSCSALRKVLGPDGTRREGELIAAAADGAPFAGFYTCGEIARTRGIDGFHNQTLVVLAIS
jgi:hypothetical protein